jgi:hypothetical protein
MKNYEQINWLPSYLRPNIDVEFCEKKPEYHTALQDPFFFAHLRQQLLNECRGLPAVLVDILLVRIGIVAVAAVLLAGADPIQFVVSW